MALLLRTIEGDLMAIIAEVMKELQRERARLDKAIGALAQLVGANHTGSRESAKGPKRTLSASARRRISLAQKARWAKTKRADAPRPVRTMSNSARRKVAAAQRERWAKWRAAEKKAA
jgi:hypothetical protein